MNNDSLDASAEELGNSLDAKIDHLNALRDALRKKDDLAIYRLINAKRFNELIKPEHPEDDQYDISLMISDLKDELSHYLSDRLIDYLGNAYPFFYYNEYQFGRFRIYFGNWWDHKLFGELDVLNVQFDFNDEELNRLGHSFKLEAENKTFYSDDILAITDENQQLQTLIDSQADRDVKKDDLRTALRENEAKSPMPWDAGKVKEEHQQLSDRYQDLVSEDEQAVDAKRAIKQNEAKILDLNKEDTIISYEKQSIRDTFKNFSNFMDVQDHLYYDYLSHLAKNYGVIEDEG
ncbi:hypothetical protein ACYATO_04160 [Lactobacillaceae bacterium Melli_B3]